MATTIEGIVDRHWAGYCRLADGQGLPCDHLVWAGGLRARPLVETDVRLSGYSLAEAGKRGGMSEGAAKVSLHRASRKTECDLCAWIERGRASLVASFANGIDRDINAVRAAITSGWSNGQAEGQITKLKLVKRQMYGRGKLDLLQARLIGATP